MPLPSIPPSPPPALPTPSVPLQELAGDTHLTQAQKIGELSRQFEALLLRQILNEAIKPVFRSSFTPTSAASGIYRGLFVKELADKMSQAGTIGFAATLKEQLMRELPHPGPAGSNQPATPSSPSRL